MVKKQFDLKEHAWVAIIAGGNGTRLFPLSHKNRPKQFVSIKTKKMKGAFIQLTAKRFIDIGVRPSHIVVIVTNDNQQKLAKEKLLPMGILSQNIHQISPLCGYAGAMICAGDFIGQIDPDSVIINTPSDQHIVPSQEFIDAITAGIENTLRAPTIIGVKINDLVTFMGCGHALHAPVSEETSDKPFISSVDGFVEKPDEMTADKMMRAGNSSCNTGINIWTYRQLAAATKNIDRDDLPKNGSNLGTDIFMQQFNKLDIVVGKFEWYDCGTLKALYEISEKVGEHHMNVSIGDVHRDECLRSLFVCDLPDTSLYAYGFEDDACVVNIIDGRYVLVATPLDESQRVRYLAEKYEEITDGEFGIDSRNNTVVKTNMSEYIRVGLISEENITVHALKIYLKQEDGSEKEHVIISATKLRVSQKAKAVA